LLIKIGEGSLSAAPAASEPTSTRRSEGFARAADRISTIIEDADDGNENYCYNRNNTSGPFLLPAPRSRATPHRYQQQPHANTVPRMRRPTSVVVTFFRKKNSVARARRRFAVHVPERRITPVHATFETDCANAARERRRDGRRGIRFPAVMHVRR